MKLSSGPARIGFYREQGVTVALGTDGEKENNNLDMLEEMKFASLLQKVSTLDPTTGDPWDILDMATAEELFERRRQLQGDTPSPATTLGKNV